MEVKRTELKIALKKKNNRTTGKVASEKKVITRQSNNI